MAEPFPSLAPSTPQADPEKRPASGLVRSHTISANRHDHPYLIRTTSSSLLTRSNSIGSVKPPPMAAVSPASPALGRSQGRGHKYTKSNTFVPPPLPLGSPERPETIIPLSPIPALDVEDLRRRVRRSETLPSIHAKSSENLYSVEDLPTNPKVWTSSHLATYLSSALRVKGGGSLPVPVIRDIATFVVNQKLSGRVFLRLTQRDLEDMGMNQLWRPALLNASRALRQNVVHGRIWGFGSATDELPASPSSSISSITTKHTSLPSVPTTVFEDYFDERAEGGAMSGPDEKHEGTGWIARGMLSSSTTSNGKVKGMVATFERNASSSSGASDNSADEEAATPSPFDFDSPSAEADDLLSPVPSLTFLPEGLSATEQYALYEREPITSEPHEDELPGTEPTSGSEAGDEEEEEEAVGGDITTMPDMSDIQHEAGASDGEQKDGGSDSDCSPTSSILPQTPPPVYAVGPAVVEIEPDANALVEEAALREPLPTSPPHHSHSRSPSATIVLTARRNPSYMAHISKDSGSDDTIENLIANFNSADHPLAASWGANAWLEDGLPGSTARKIHEPVSISRRGNLLSQGRAGHESKRPSLSGLFQDDLATSVETTKSDVTVDAATPSVDDAETLADLKDKQARQEVLLEEFRARLEEVEKRLEEMEQRERGQTEGSELDSAKPTRAASPTFPEDYEGSATQVVGPVPPSPRLGNVSDENKPATHETPAPDDEWEDPTLGQLPSYVFLVGLGVCAIAMRVMIKRVVGKKANLLGFT